jgi:hypothetical protein
VRRRVSNAIILTAPCRWVKRPKYSGGKDFQKTSPPTKFSHKTRLILPIGSL